MMKTGQTGKRLYTVVMFCYAKKSIAENIGIGMANTSEKYR
jgi:hypothetical protein